MLHLGTKYKRYKRSKKDKKKASKIAGLIYPPSYCDGCEFKAGSGECLCKEAIEFARKIGVLYVQSWVVRGTRLCERCGRKTKKN